MLCTRHVKRLQRAHQLALWQLQILANKLVDLSSGFIRANDDQCVIALFKGLGCVRVRDSLVTLWSLLNLMYVLFERKNGTADVVVRGLLDSGFQGCVLLTLDLGDMCELHPCVPKLLEGLARLDRLCLLTITE